MEVRRRCFGGWWYKGAARLPYLLPLLQHDTGAAFEDEKRVGGVALDGEPGPRRDDRPVHPGDHLPQLLRRQRREQLVGGEGFGDEGHRPGRLWGPPPGRQRLHPAVHVVGVFGMRRQVVAVHFIAAAVGAVSTAL